MTENIKPYNLEERTLEFAKRINVHVRKLPKSITNLENGKQLVRSAGSVGANYIEANESLGKKDFAMRIRISRKEAKESAYWLKLTESSSENELEKTALIQEAVELVKIFNAIIKKSQ